MSQRPTASQSHVPRTDFGAVGVGCDGRIIDSHNTDLVFPESTTNAWWTAQFSSMQKITTFLIIYRDWLTTEDRITKYYTTVGNATQFATNPKCVNVGSMTNGGWYSCSPQPLFGSYFSILCDGVINYANHLNFPEIMLYSEEVI